MARKKKPVDNSKKSKVALSPDNAHPIQTLYKLLRMTGVIKTKEDAVIPYDTGSAHLSIAVPSIKFGIAFNGDKVSELEDNGWHIEHVSYHDLEPFSRIFFSVEAARVAELYSKVDPNVKSTSHAEERLFSEIIRRGLPVPDRNLKFTRDNGTELTTPDFAWEEYKVSFFMDGAYWHSIKDDQSIIKEIKSSKKMRDDIVEKRKDKVRKDGAIRSELGSMGWIVLSCTDDDIEDSEGLHEVVDMIERTLRKAEASRQFRESVNMSYEDDNALSSLLMGKSPDSSGPEESGDDQDSRDDDNSIDVEPYVSSPNEDTSSDSSVSPSEEETDSLLSTGQEDEATVTGRSERLSAPQSASEVLDDLDPHRDSSTPENGTEDGLRPSGSHEPWSVYQNENQPHADRRGAESHDTEDRQGIPVDTDEDNGHDVPEDNNSESSSDQESDGSGGDDDLLMELLKPAEIRGE